MRADKYLQKTSNIFRENLLLKTVVTVLAAGFIVMSWLTHRTMKNQMTVVIPAGMTEKVKVGLNLAGEVYLNRMARYIAGLFLSYTPSSARIQFEQILADVHPRVYNHMRSTLYDLADRIEMADVTTVFFPEEILYHEKNDEKIIELGGYRVQYKHGKAIDNTKTAYYITYLMESGRFYILDIAEKAAAVRKTKEVI